MARVLAFLPDLLFGSAVVSSLQSAGHDVVLAAEDRALAAALPGAEVLVVDLTADAAARIEAVRVTGAARPPVLGFYSHVESGVREMAQQAGFELVVPRSRMARDGAGLVARLAAGGD